MILPNIIESITFPPNSRIIAVSDIHGNLPFLRGLMEKTNLSPTDHLVIVGDMLEKGRESLALLRYVMALSKTHQVHTLCGNCDGLVQVFFNGDDWDVGFFHNYIPQHPESTISQMAAEIGFTQLDDLPALRLALRENFAEEWQFLREMPTMLESEELLFVHGGVPALEGKEKLDAWHCMKNDYFWEQNRSFSKYLVVGHCPVTLYDDKIPCAAPRLDLQRKILSIDGGCVLKLDGQLNGLIITLGDEMTLDWACYDGLPTVVALENQAASQDSFNLRWGHHQVEVLERGEEFSLCRQVETGREMNILTRFLYQQKGKTMCQDTTDYLLPVTPGDILSVCEVVSGGILAKKNGVTGWYWGATEETKEK